MDKRVILAVAGSGKSATIINKLSNESKALIVTYTDLNAKQLKQRIIKKFGYIPDGIRVYTYFSFLYSFCYRPLCGYKLKTKGLIFPKESIPRGFKKDNLRYYIDKNNRLYANRVAKLLIEFDLMPEVIQRIDKYFDFMCIDEVQDFSANDFNFLCGLKNLKKEMLLVGDFYQHTYDTSRDGSTRKNLHNSLEGYSKELIKAGFEIDKQTLSNSYRCSPTVCRFVTEKLKININSHKANEAEIKLIDEKKEIQDVFSNDSIVKLFYKDSKKYTSHTKNWGEVKGSDEYDDVCIVLNPTTFNAYVSDSLHELKPSTLNKLYVACTRAKGNLYFIEEKKLHNFKP